MRQGPLPVLQLDESPYFVSLYDPTQRGRLDVATKVPLYPFAYGWLLVVERWRGFEGWGLRTRALTARPSTLEATVQLGRLIPRHYLKVRNERIERLVVDIGGEGEREIAFTLRVQYRDRRDRPLSGEARFVVADVDTHREAMALWMRFARMLGCVAYRTSSRDDGGAGLGVELLFSVVDAKAGGYRDPGRPADVHPIPDDDEVTDFRPREHGGFVEPVGLVVAEPRPQRAGIETFELGERVVAGSRARPWRLLLLPLLAVGWLVVWLIGVLVCGMIVGLVGAILGILGTLVGIDLWWLLLAELTTKVTVVVAGLGALAYVVPPGVVLLQQALGSRVTIDWSSGRVTRGGLVARTTMPLSHVRGVDVRASLGQRRLLLRTSEGDVALASGGEELTPIAVALARSLDVPVTHPDG